MKTITPEITVDQQRRSFLKLSGLLGLGVAGAALLPAEKAEAMLFGKKEFKVSKTKLSMGSYVAITAIHSSRDQAEQAIGLAFEEIERLGKIFSHYEDGTPLTTLNTSGQLAEIPAELSEVVARAMYFHRETGGAFDITVKPMIDLYKESFAAGRTPADGEIEKTLKRVGGHKLHFRNNILQFSESDMAVTLDGIAVGYIVDRVSAVMSKNGVSNHLINASGDIRVSGTAAQGKDWTVAIQDPEKKREYPDVVSMREGAISTSGNYEIYYDQEKLFHHIVDGRTGRSPHLAKSVTVMAPTVQEADALSTGVFVMGPQAGVEFINQREEYRCFIMASDGSVSHSRNWKA